jgi:4-amino-4-deoxy-L-arabinose transferase-like glycosyltransferase
MSATSPSPAFRWVPDQNPLVLLSRRDLLVACGLAGVVILLGAWQMVVGVCGVYHDDAIYVITAKALAQGQGYRLIDLPNAPLQTKYPILYPALLSIIWKIWPSFPENLLAMQGLSLLAGAATVALAYLYLVHFGYTSRGVALAAALFCATSAYFLYFNTITLSEIPYALISLLALWALERQTRSPLEKPGLQFVLGFLLGLPFLTRSIGLVLVPAGLVTLYLAGKRIHWVSLGVAFVVVPWVLWMIVGTQHSQDEIGIYYTNYGGWWSAFGWLNLSRLFLINLFCLTANIATIGFSLSDTLVKQFTPTITICVTLGSITILSIFKQLKYNKLLSLYLVGYLSIIMLWPWPPSRFIIPILPFLLGYLLNEIWIFINKYYVKYNIRYLITFLLIIILVINLSSNYMIGKSNRLDDYPYPTILKEPVSWSSYLSIFHWINHRTRPDDIIAAGLDTMVYLYTNRRSFRPFTMNPLSLFYSHHSPPLALADLIRILQAYRPKYLIQTPMPGFSEEKPFSKILNEVGVKYPGLLKTVYVGQDKRFLVYEIQAHLLAATGSSASAGQAKRAGM